MSYGHRESTERESAPYPHQSLLAKYNDKIRQGFLSQKLIQGLTYLVVAYLVLLPILLLAYGSIRTAPPGAESSFTIANFQYIFRSQYISALQNTIVLGVSTALACAVFGTAMAWLVFRSNMPGRRWMAVLIVSSFFFPSFLTAEAWVILLAPRSGILNNLIRAVFPDFGGLNIYSMAGIIWVSAISYIPYTFLFLSGPLQSMDPSLEEAATVSGAGRLRVVFLITLPLVGYAILSGALLTFILAIGLFGVPAIVGMPAQIYVLATQIYSLLEFYPSNYQVAAALSVMLMALTIAVVVLQRYLTSRTSYTTVTGKAYRPRLIDLGRLRWAAFGACSAYFVVAVLLPTLALLYTSLQRFYTGQITIDGLTLHHYYEVMFVYPITGRAFTNSFILSSVGATAAIVLCTLVSYIVLKSQMRGRNTLETLTMLPAAIPGLVISVGLLWAYIQSPIYGTVFILLVSYVTHYLPQGFRIVSSNMIQLDNSLEESARVSGATWTRTLLSIITPLLRPALIGGWLLLFVAFFRELSSAVLLYTHGNEVLSVAIWDLHQNGNLGMLSALAILMLAAVYSLFFVMQWFGLGLAKPPDD